MLGSDGTVYLGSTEGTFYALDGTTGQPRWTYKTGSSALQSSPALASDGTLFIGGMDGKVHAIASGSSGVADSSWPMFRGNLRRTGQASLPSITPSLRWVPRNDALLQIEAIGASGARLILETSSDLQNWNARQEITGQGREKPLILDLQSGATGAVEFWRLRTR